MRGLSQCIIRQILTWDVGAFWDCDICGKVPKLPFKFCTLLDANAIFLESEFLSFFGITIRTKWMLA